MTLLLLAICLAVVTANAAPLDNVEPVEMIVNGVPEGEPVELGDILDIKLKQKLDGEVVSSSDLLYPLTAQAIAEAAAAAEALEESVVEPDVTDSEVIPEQISLPAPAPVNIPESVALPAPATPEVIPEPIVLPAPVPVNIPEPVALPALPAPEVIPEPIALPAPAAPEVVPEPISLPSPALPELIPEAVAIPAPGLPEVVLEPVAIPVIDPVQVVDSTPEVVVGSPIVEAAAPEPVGPLPSPSLQIYADGTVEVTDSPNGGFLESIQNWAHIAINYIFNDNIKTVEVD